MPKPIPAPPIRRRSIEPPSERVAFVGRLVAIKDGLFIGGRGYFYYEIEEVFRGLRAEPGDLVILKYDIFMMEDAAYHAKGMVGERQLIESDRQSRSICDGAWFRRAIGEARIEEIAQNLRASPDYHAPRTVKWESNWLERYYIKVADEDENLFIAAVLLSLLSVILLSWILLWRVMGAAFRWWRNTRRQGGR